VVEAVAWPWSPTCVEEVLWHRVGPATQSVQSALFCPPPTCTGTSPVSMWENLSYEDPAPKILAVHPAKGQPPSQLCPGDPARRPVTATTPLPLLSLFGIPPGQKGRGKDAGFLGGQSVSQSLLLCLPWFVSHQCTRWGAVGPMDTPLDNLPPCQILWVQLGEKTQLLLDRCLRKRDRDLVSSQASQPQCPSPGPLSLVTPRPVSHLPESNGHPASLRHRLGGLAVELESPSCKHVEVGSQRAFRSAAGQVVCGQEEGQLRTATPTRQSGA
jgi:hypothetical protein